MPEEISRGLPGDPDDTHSRYVEAAAFAELKRLSHINARAHAAGDAPDFSQRIRAGLPMPTPASR